MTRYTEEDSIVEKLMNLSIDNRLMIVAILYYLQESNKQEITLNLDEMAKRMMNLGIEIKAASNLDTVSFRIIHRKDHICNNIH